MSSAPDAAPAALLPGLQCARHALADLRWSFAFIAVQEAPDAPDTAVRALVEGLAAAGIDAATVAMTVLFTSRTEHGRQRIRDTWPPGIDPWPMQVVAHPPVGAAGAFFVTALSGMRRTRSSWSTATFVAEDCQLVFFDAGSHDHVPSARDGYRDSFERADELLRSQGMDFGRVARTFTTLSHSADVESAFADFNAAREAFFSSLTFEPSVRDGHAFPRYPANTGTLNGECSVTLAGMAATGSGLRMTGLQNPRQSSPMSYRQSGLTPNVPMFSRGLTIAHGRAAMTLVSGGVAVVGSTLLHPQDAAAQARTVLANIDALLDGSNLDAHGVAAGGAGRPLIAYYLVFLKHARDLEAVRAVVAARDPVPTLYVQAAQALTPLRVEIECVAFHGAAVRMS